MLAHLGAMLAHLGAMVAHLEPQDPKKGEKKNGWSAAGGAALSPTERRELPYSKDTARGPLAVFQRLRATAGQGPTMLAYLAAMFAYVGLMLNHVEPKEPKNGNSKKTL